MIVDEVRERDEEMWLGTAEGVMEKIKKGMPSEWVSMIERGDGMNGGGDVEMYVGEGETKIKLTNVKTRVMYKYLRWKEVRRPAGENAWGKVMIGMDVKRMWKNLRVKWNSSECENFDFFLRHNRVFNNLVISRFDMNVRKECDVCRVGVENCMHEFVECSELKVYFERMRELISRNWRGEFVERMDWRELWLFGVTGKVRECNVSLMNYVLSHARFAVKLRRNLAHFEKKIVDVWNIFVMIVKRDVKMIYSYEEKGNFIGGFVEGSTLISLGENGDVLFNF